MKISDTLKNIARKLFYAVLIVGVLSMIAIIFAEVMVNRSSSGKIYDSVEDVPVKKTALLLGSNKYAANGLENLFYKYRIDSAVKLYKAEKVSFILVSGDNSTKAYSEPDLILKDLVASGIPEDRIYQDYAGFRTWDSIIRANKVFLENDFTIISQEFHNERALYIAKVNGIDAIAFNAHEVPVSRSPRIWLRERLARVKVVLDAVTGKNPKFLGDTVKIEISEGG